MFKPEIGPDGLPREAPVIAYTEKIIEEEQLQLRKYIEENYSKIRDVERELGNLSLEMKLTAGPKKAGWYVCFHIVVFTLVYSNFADFDVGFVDGGVWMKLSA